MSGIYGQDWSGYTSAKPTTHGVSFTFIKVTEGLSYVNPNWVSQRETAEAAGILTGFYHYPHMHNNADAEINYFLAKVAPKPGEPVVLDWEGYDANNKGVSDAEKRAYKDTFLKDLKAKLPHNPVGLYCNKSYWVDIDTNSYYQDFLWIATGGLPAGAPGIKANWLFHQYGVKGADLDYCKLSLSDLHAWSQSFVPVKPPTKPTPSKPTVDLSNLIKAAQTDPKSSQGHQTYASGVKLVESALYRAGLLSKKYYADGSFGSLTVKAYGKWQAKCGYKGTDTNGIPGYDSLVRLGKKYGFNVVK